MGSRAGTLLLAMPLLPNRPHLASLIMDLERLGDQPAVVGRRGLRMERTSYGELARLAGRYARELESRGIAKGQRAVIWGASGSEWIGSFFGCILRGVVPVPLDIAGSPEFIKRVIAEVSPELVTGSQEQLRVLNGSVPQIAIENFEKALPRAPLLEPVES